MSTTLDGAKILADWLGDGGYVVDRETAQSRANVCLKCPLNVDGNPVVAAVASAIKQMLELKNRMRLRTVGEKSLKRCGACNCEMRLKVWMPVERIKLVTDAETFALLHESCWIRTEAAT